MKAYAYMFVVGSLISISASTPSHAQAHRRHSRLRSVSARACEYKSISVPTDNGQNQKLSHSYNLREIATAMRLNHDYEVNDRASGGVGLVVSRTCNRVKYNIVFDVFSGVYEFNLNTYNFSGYRNGLVTGGEKCTTPNYLIKRKIYRMIDDLPLSLPQKAELKHYVRVVRTINFRLPV